MDDGGGDRAQRAAKRRKTKLACEVCRDRKVRCDGAKPVCSSCSRRKERCVYVDPSADLDPDYVKSLEGRIRELERGRVESSSGPPSRQHVQLLPPEDQVVVQPLLAAPSNESHLAAAQLMYFRQVGHDVGDRDSRRPPSRRAGPVPTAMPRPSPANTNSPHLHRPSEPLSEPRHLSPSLNAPVEVYSPCDATLQASTAEQERYAPAVEEHGDLHPDMQPGTAMGAAESTPTDSGGLVYLGRSSAAAFMKEVQENSGSQRRSGFAAEDATSSAPSRASVFKRKKEQEEVNALLEDLILPPRRVADAHLANYWELVHPLYPVLHRPTFMRRYDNLWNHDQTQGYETNVTTDNVHILRAFHATFNIALALGCSFALPKGPTPSSKRNAEIFYERSQELISHASVDHGSIQLVQALILTAQYLQSTDLVNKCWVTCGMAIRVAQGIGIQLNLPSESQAERQERKRTWWCCVMMDRVLSMTFGRPPMVVWPTVVTFPEDVDDELLRTEPGSVSQPLQIQDISAVSFFVQAIKLTKILMTVLKHFYFPLPETRPAGIEGARIEDFAMLFDIDAQLGRWRQELPLPLVYHDGPTVSPAEATYARQGLALMCRYLHLRILLFRPTTVELSTGRFLEARARGLTTDFQHGVLTGCIQSCIAAAQELINLIHSPAYVGLRLPWWYAVFYLYTAGTVVLAVLLIPSLQEASPNGFDSIETSWAQCIDSLSMYERSESTFAKKCLRVLKTLHSQQEIYMSLQTQTNNEDGQQFHMEGESATVAVNQQIPMFPRSGHVPGVWLNPSGMGGADHLGEDMFDSWWSAGSLDWLNNLPDDFDQQQSH